MNGATKGCMRYLTHTTSETRRNCLESKFQCSPMFAIEEMYGKFIRRILDGQVKTCFEDRLIKAGLCFDFEVSGV